MTFHTTVRVISPFFFSSSVGVAPSPLSSSPRRLLAILFFAFLAYHRLSHSLAFTASWSTVYVPHLCFQTASEVFSKPVSYASCRWYSRQPVGTSIYKQVLGCRVVCQLCHSTDKSCQIRRFYMTCFCLLLLLLVFCSCHKILHVTSNNCSQ